MAISTLDILTCKITIGDESPDNMMEIQNPIVLTEVQNIEIVESYKQLIGTAQLTFPKGTMFKSTIVKDVTLEGRDTTKVTTEIMKDGIVIEKRSTQSMLDDKSIKVGQRIRIQIGYNDILKTMFEGYVISYNSDNPVLIKCENMAYKLKLKQAPNIDTGKSVSINNLLEGKYNLLKDTGFKINPETKKWDINIGRVIVKDNLTIADILITWQKSSLFSYLKYEEGTGVPTIAVGRPYNNSKKESLIATENLGDSPYKIYFNYHVAQNNLTVLKIDPKFLAVTGKAVDKKQRMQSVTVRLNPEYDPKDKSSEEFQIINEVGFSKKGYKLQGRVKMKKDKIDLTTYNVVPYTSNTLYITKEELIKETIKYFRDYNLNGISGDISIFGDFGLHSAVQVELIDTRNPSKNGVYIVEEVVTTFGVDGYRQKLSLPYKVKGVIKYGDGESAN